MLPRSLPPSIRARGVTAVLGPTNTGKTHLAIERMVAHGGGLIGLPLRLLAREVYQRLVERTSVDAVALVTGEEKIKPPGARFWVATVEAMPRDLEVPFVAIDEIQLAADRDRGHVFTDRLLNMRGRSETLLIGAATMKPLIERLLPGANIVSRPRLSQLTFAGEKKLTRLPRRSAIVAFSAEEVYAIAELIRRQRGGAAVVMGALSPRTRNAQVEMYQSGDVDYLIATDAIGMGLNLDVDHVAFAADRKFDGAMHRRLNPAEFGQIAGRAGRHLRDGTFGTTGRCEPFDTELARSLEDHVFDAVKVLQWRNPELDFGTVARLVASLDRNPAEQGLTRAIPADDVIALETVAHDPELKAFASSPTAVSRLWDVCQVPDYRRVAPAAHADLVGTIYRQLMRDGRLSEDWFAARVAEVDRTDGDLDTLSNRIAQGRTWTFVANRPDWLRDPEHWQRVTRQVEDRLSDALHERLAQRFVDRRTSVLMRRLRENAMLEAEITAAGDVLVEGHAVGRLHGFQFAPDPQAGGPEAKALRNAALKALANEIDTRAARLSGAGDDAFVLANDGAVRWQGEVVAKLTAGEKLLEPRLRLLADEQLTGGSREQVQARLDLWIKAHVEKLLGPLLKLENAETLTGIARGLAFQIAEALGVLERSKVADEMKHLDQEGRGALRNFGVRFGAYHLTVPALLKPAPRGLAAQLWALKHGGSEPKGLDDILHLAASGRTSIPVDKEVARGLYRAAGFRVCGERAVRVDILERLADLIRPAIHYRPGVTPGEPPAGAADGEGFVVTTAMTSLCGCAGEDFASILRSLGYLVDRRPGPAITVALAPMAPTTPAVQAAAPAADAPAEASAAEAAATDANVAEAASTETVTDAPGGETAAPAEAATADVGSEAAEPTPLDAIAADFAVRGVAPEAADAAAALDAEDAAQPAIAEAVAQPALADESETALTAQPMVDAAGSDAPAETAEPAAPAEPILIEVWRQHRHQGGQRPARDRNARGQERNGQARNGHARNGAAPGEAPQGERGPRPDRGPRPERGPRPARPEGGGENRQDARPAGRPDHRGDNRPQGERPDHRGPRRDDRFGKGGPNRGGPAKFGGKPGGGGKPAGGWTDRPPREKAPDPNSPFAKLLALKAELESKQKG
ncbi:helicase [Alsobacter metallidurans]|uniref:Helicase n=1 Tax=Alsobacter metallidurans TaxID=340221 RepID=A0A917IAT4_9HYPH|nr:helicase-related protein [Alsobacter metallidurans]GGH31473.1 helicase [Alsobacter metallidurans]